MVVLPRQPLTSGEVPTVTFALLTMSLMMQGWRVAMVSSNVAPVSEYTSRANSVTCVICRGGARRGQWRGEPGGGSGGGSREGVVEGEPGGGGRGGSREGVEEGGAGRGWWRGESGREW